MKPGDKGRQAGDVIVCDDVALGYDGRPCVRHVSGRVAHGEMLAIVGPNGGGKSTLLKGLAGLMKPLSGAIRHQGLHRPDIAYLPQLADVDRSFPISVLDLVAAGAWRAMGAWGGFGGGKRVAALRALAAVGLTGFENRSIGALSGGQMQRALFARLILQDARLLLLDEPFAAVDHDTMTDLLRLIGDWRAEGRTVIAVLHDLDMVRSQFPRTLLLAGAPVAWGATGDALGQEHLLSARGARPADAPTFAA